MTVCSRGSVNGKRRITRRAVAASPAPTPPATRDRLSLTDLKRWAEAWRLDCRANNASPEYLEKIDFISVKLLWWLEREGRGECGANELRRFQIYVQEAHALPEGRWGDSGETNRPSQFYKPVSTRTVLNYWRLLRTLFAWLVEQEALTVTPFKTLRAPEHNADEVQPFTEEQVRALLEATKRSPAPLRNRAVVLFLLDTGVRATELCALKWRDVDISEPGRPCAIILGKGRKRRTVYWSPETHKALNSYVQQSGGRTSDDPVFRSSSYQSSDGHLCRRGLGLMIDRLGEDAGIQGIRCSPHIFRNTYAVMFLRAGGPEIALMTNLGHTNLEMTRRYVLFARADRANHARAFSPVANLKKRGK